MRSCCCPCRSPWRPAPKFTPLAFLLGLAGFCLLNSAVYTLNDWRNAATDRLHPTKRLRPMAAGRVPPAVGGVQAFLLALVGLVLCWAAHKPPTVAIAIAYLVINLAYSFGAKHVVLLDVFLLSSGFVIRVLLGCALVSAGPSPWLLLCTATLALLLGFTKRRRPHRGTGLGPPAEPPRLQQVVSRPGREHLRRRGHPGLRAVLH